MHASTSNETRKGGILVKATSALGYDWRARMCTSAFKDPESRMGYVLGWLLHKDIRRLDIAGWVNQMQKNLFWKRVRTIIKRGGRK